MLKSSVLAATIIAGMTVGAAGQVDMDAVEEALRGVEDAEAEHLGRMDSMMTAREVSQAIALADLCSIEMNTDRVAELAGEITTSDDPMARTMFQSSGRAHQMRMKRMTEIEKAAACGSAKAVAERHGLID